MRDWLKRAAAEALQISDAWSLVRQRLPQQPIDGEVSILAIGKAAAMMQRAAAEVLAECCLASLVIAPEAYPDTATCRFVQGAHPVPDQRSLQAGEAALAFVQQLPANSTLLVLLSGGASALCEKLPAEISLQDLQALNRYLIASNYSIEQINAVRQSLSLLKAGRLARQVNAGINIVQWLISDVPNDDPAIIGSGPFIVSTAKALPDLPEPFSKLVKRAQATVEHLDQRPMPGVETAVLVGSRAMAQALVRWAEAQGINARYRPLYGDIDEVAATIVEEVENHDAQFFVFAGETHLQLPAQPGKGGRNQHLALLLAKKWSAHTSHQALCFGSDGRDGSSDAAGAIFDCATLNREGLDEAIAKADSYHWWQARNGLLFTGATTTNVADLCLVWKSP